MIPYLHAWRPGQDRSTFEGARRPRARRMRRRRREQWRIGVGGEGTPLLMAGGGGHAANTLGEGRL
jgi:hypothetical protein